MVILLGGSAVEEAKYPNAYKWDSLVRKHYNNYQNLIDAETYRLQRIQRNLLSLPYPKFYNTELLSLDLLRKKQQLGEVDQVEIDLYRNIDPAIGTHFKRTFSSGFNLPQLGLAVGGGLFLYASYFNFTVPTRLVLLAVPIVIDFLRITRDPFNEQHSLDFLNWVIGYRQAKCFAELHRTRFQNQELEKIAKGGNLADLGHQLVDLASR